MSSTPALRVQKWQMNKTKRETYFIYLESVFRYVVGKNGRPLERMYIGMALKVWDLGYICMKIQKNGA